MGKGLLNRCASCTQDAHTGQQLMLGMIYRSALVSGCFSAVAKGLLLASPQCRARAQEGTGV